MPERDLYFVVSTRLAEAQMAAPGRCAGATLKHYRARVKLIEVGERDSKFFGVKSGEVEIDGSQT